ncbi:Uncharacterized protein Fot_01901 [Forsythia ovata]|uniref:Transmembrane protein n=1 Tax=Forsythia ovata TaxID=205694 RepID=A0ABD1X5U9_9LAMI
MPKQTLKEKYESLIPVSRRPVAVWSAAESNGIHGGGSQITIAGLFVSLFTISGLPLIGFGRRGLNGIQVLVVKGAVRWKKRSCVEIAAERVRERMRNFGRMDEGFKFCLCMNSDMELSTREREEVGRQKRKRGRRTGKGESGSPESEGRRKWRKGFLGTWK